MTMTMMSMTAKDNRDDDDGDDVDDDSKQQWLLGLAGGAFIMDSVLRLRFVLDDVNRAGAGAASAADLAVCP